MDESVFLIIICVLIVVSVGEITDAVISSGLAFSPSLFPLCKNVRQSDAVGYVTWQS